MSLQILAIAVLLLRFAPNPAGAKRFSVLRRLMQLDTRNELAFSKEHKDAFHLYRLFEFRKQPKMFDLPDSVERHCMLHPVTFVGRFS